MIPYVYLPAWGLCVGIAVLVGMWFADVRARQLALPPSAVAEALTIGIGGAFVFAHVFEVAAYRGDRVLAEPALLIDPRYGWSVSSFGGFFGGAIAVAAWARIRRVHALPFFDSFAFGLAPAWILGRLGCFSVHDHVGRATDFFLAVRFPGGARHDLALYEVLLAGALTCGFLFAGRRRRPVGTYVVAACMVYAPVRFALDFLRATDVVGAEPRWLGLTPGQYSAVVVLALGLVAHARAARSGATRDEPPTTAMASTMPAG